MKKIKIIAGQSERAFMTGVLVLSLSTVIVKVIGLAYKIPLLSILGTEGMGYFNSAYEIYAILCVISTAGFPVAVSIMISGARERGDIQGGERIYRTSLYLLSAFGFVGSLLLSILSGPISVFIGNENAHASILAVSPALFFACVSGAVRGYFQGCRNMSPTAVSQLVEATGKLLLGVSFAAWAYRQGFSVSVASAFAVLGLVIGSLISTAYLLILKASDKKKHQNEGIVGIPGDQRYRALPALIRIAFPITLGAGLLGITRVIDMTLIMRRLQDIGISSSAANKIYGSYTTLALPIFSLIPALVTPISESLVPRLSAAVESGERAEQSAAVEKSVKLTVLLGMPASMGISIYSKQIISLLFANQTEAIAIASPLLSVLGASVLFSCLITTTNAILHAYRKVYLPIISVAVGAAVKTISAYILIGVSNIGELGAPISTFICNVTVVGMNLYFTDRCVSQKASVLRPFIKPFGASTASMIISVATYLPIVRFSGNDSIAFLSAMMAAVVSYFFFAYIIGAIDSDDLASISPIEKMVGAVKRLKK